LWVDWFMERGLLFLSILSFILLVCGCTGISSNTTKDTTPQNTNMATPQNTYTVNPQNTSVAFSQNTYVAVLEEYNNKSTLIGNTPYTPIRPMAIPTPVPNFVYNRPDDYTLYELQANGNAVNDSFKILLGKISYIDTPTSLGYLGMTIKGIYAFPYTIEKGFTIVDVTNNGTMIATYNGQTIYLKPGENWSSIISSVNTTGAYLANRDMTELPWPVNNEISITITNKGIYNKSLLNSSYVY
jgi:hypothetical protein